MYAIIKTGGKQYRVAPGGSLRVEKLDAEEGATIEFDQVLLVGDGDAVSVGAPYVDGGKVMAVVQEHGKARKIEVVKFKRRKGYLRNRGHRQPFTRITVTEISAG